MNKLKFNPDNAKYYSEEFIKGFNCGVERQFNADMEEKTTINSTKTTITDGDLISRQAVKDLIRKFKKGFAKTQDEKYFDYVIAGVELLPSAEKTAHWVGIDDFPNEDWECDNCGFIITGIEEPYRFCPNCGAKMKESEEE